MTGSRNSSFVWPEDGSIAPGWGQRSVRGSNKIAVVREVSLKLFCYTPSFLKKIIHLFLSHISIWCFKYHSSSSPRIRRTFWHCDVNITWLREPIKIRPSVNNSTAGNCWPVNRSVLQLVGILLLTAKMLCFIELVLYRRKSDGV